MLSKLMIEQGDLLKTQLQYKTTLEVYHEAGTLNIDDETLRERIEADMDFKIPGLPHSIVKHAQSTSVENHKSTCSATRSTTESII